MAKRAFKYRIYPTYEQEQLIRKTVGCARFTYNALLDNYKTQLNNYNLTKENKPQIIEITALKPANTFLCEVDSLALANAKQHLQQALQNFFNSKKG